LGDRNGVQPVKEYCTDNPHIAIHMSVPKGGSLGDLLGMWP